MKYRIGAIIVAVATMAACSAAENEAAENEAAENEAAENVGVTQQNLYACDYTGDCTQLDAYMGGLALEMANAVGETFGGTFAGCDHNYGVGRQQWCDVSDQYGVTRCFVAYGINGRVDEQGCFALQP